MTDHLENSLTHSSAERSQLPPCHLEHRNAMPVRARLPVTVVGSGAPLPAQSTDPSQAVVGITTDRLAKVRYLVPLLVVGLVGCSEPEPRDPDALVQQDHQYPGSETMKSDSGPVDLDSLLQQGDLYLVRESMTPYSGPVVRYLHGETTRVFEVGSLEHGRKEGPFELYPSEGGVSKGPYSNGELHGLWESFYKNGQLKSKEFYSKGEQDGPYEMFAENGQLQMKGTFFMGVECGVWMVFGESWTHPPCPTDSDQMN